MVHAFAGLALDLTKKETGITKSIVRETRSRRGQIREAKRQGPRAACIVDLVSLKFSTEREVVSPLCPGNGVANDGIRGRKLALPGIAQKCFRMTGGPISKTDYRKVVRTGIAKPELLIPVAGVRGLTGVVVNAVGKVRNIQNLGSEGVGLAEPKLVVPVELIASVGKRTSGFRPRLPDTTPIHEGAWSVIVNPRSRQTVLFPQHVVQLDHKLIGSLPRCPRNETSGVVVDPAELGCVVLEELIPPLGDR